MRAFSRDFVEGGKWSMLFLVLLGCLAGALVTFLAGRTVYSVLLFLLAVFAGAALWQREAE